MKHALVIVNPHSRNGDADELEQAIDVIREAGVTVEVYESQGKSEMLDKIAKYPHQDDGVIAIAGGDGTVSTALPALHEHDQTLAVLPMGTANDLARSLGIPQDLVEAAKVIATGRSEPIDLATVNGEYFVNVAHIGLGVDVTHELTPKSKKYFGVFAYLGAFFSVLSGQSERSRSLKVEITAGDWSGRLRAMHLAVGNGRYYGGGNIVDDESTLQDGLLHLFCIKPQRWWQLLLLGPSLRKGEVRRAERIVCHAASKITIKTNKSVALEADGEFKTETPATLEVIPSAIRAVVGPDFPDNIA